MWQQDSRTEIWKHLWQEIQTPSCLVGRQAFQRRFNRFKKTHPKLAWFNTPQDLVSFFHTPNQSNLRLKDRLLHRLVSDYQIKPERKGWLMTLLLVIVWKQMEYTFSLFTSALKQINPFDPFAPVYESYIDAFLEVSQKTSKRFALHLKDRAEYLIRKELKECERFRGEPDLEIPAPEYLPWQYEVERMMEEWMMNGVLRPQESELVIKHLVYEYTFKELAEQPHLNWRTVQKRFQRAIKKLKPYLQGKYFKGI